MSLSRAVKDELLKVKLFYKLLYKVRNYCQTQYIKKEQLAFIKKAKEMGFAFKEKPSDVWSRLIQRLAERKILWPPVNKKSIHILYASVPGNWELHNLPPELEKIGKVTYFFLKENHISLDNGWARVRECVDSLLPSFVRQVHEETPIDMMLSYLSGAQISPKTIEKINQLGIPTFSFHLDDRRFFYGNKYNGQWSGPAAVCQAYDLNLTNASASLIKYKCEGGNALFWPEGANPEYFKPLDIPFEYDVTFCGARYGVRPILVDFLRKQGINVTCFGQGWENGYQTERALVRIFNASRINLGFGFVTDSEDQCLKGRDFEIPSCGAVYLTSFNEDLSRVYEIGRDIETYTSFDDCARKIKALLSDSNRCNEIRKAARRAVLEKHTWAHRIKELLNCQS